MPAFVDGTCPKCQMRFGWSGDMIDRPPCPKCGHQLPREELLAVDKELQAAEDEIIAFHERRRAKKLKDLK